MCLNRCWRSEAGTHEECVITKWEQGTHHSRLVEGSELVFAQLIPESDIDEMVLGPLVGANKFAESFAIHGHGLFLRQSQTPGKDRYQNHAHSYQSTDASTPCEEHRD